MVNIVVNIALPRSRTQDAGWDESKHKRDHGKFSSSGGGSGKSGSQPTGSKEHAKMAAHHEKMAAHHKAKSEKAKKAGMKKAAHAHSMAADGHEGAAISLRQLANGDKRLPPEILHRLVKEAQASARGYAKRAGQHEEAKR